MGKDRTTIANTIRLLSLPKKIQEFISKGMISAGHAKAILSIPAETERLRIANVVIAKGLSVRETEKLTSRKLSGAAETHNAKRDHTMNDIADKLQHALGTRVRIFHGANRGTIHIEYYSLNDLNRILDMITSKKP